MGKITVQGYAEKEVNYDLVEMTISFNAREKTAARASKEVMRQCELFLQELNTKGIKAEDIHLEEDSISKTYQDRENNTITAKRTIEVKIEFDMKLMNGIMELIQKQEGDIEYDNRFMLSNEEKIHTLLLQEAIQDARKKAEEIAAALGQKVVELKSATQDSRGGNREFEQYFKLSAETKPCYCEAGYISDDLQSPISRETESVETVWVIE